MLLVTFTPSQAQDLQLTQELRPSLRLAEVQPVIYSPAIQTESTAAAPDLQARAPAPATPALTPEVLADYVARQQARKGFDIFGEAPAPVLTSAVVSAYAATHYQNAALSAIDSAAAPAPLDVNFLLPSAETRSAEATLPSVTDDMLARYARQRFQPTAKKVAIANKEKGCLSTAIYHEARGESDNGQWAVANVIINRAMSKRFPTTMCGVVYQNADRGRFHCQFTFACDGHPDAANERRAWVKANRIASAAYSEFQRGQRPGVLPRSALYYHTRSVSPDWSSAYKQVAQIGAHVFYAPL